MSKPWRTVPYMPSLYLANRNTLFNVYKTLAMKHTFLSIALGMLLLGPLTAIAQLTGSVGPTTSTAAKRAKVCNVLDYGAKADKRTDIGQALTKAWAACASSGIG